MSGKGICCGPTLATIILTFAECSGIYDMALLVVEGCVPGEGVEIRALWAGGRPSGTGGGTLQS